jgi:hypothetical protein
MLLPADMPETMEEIEAFLAKRRRELGIPENLAAWRERKQRKQLTAFEVAKRRPN